MFRSTLSSAFVACAFYGCAIFEVVLSNLESPRLADLDLGDGVHVALGKPVDTVLLGLSTTPFVAASVRVSGAGKVLYIDPLAVDLAEPVDVILITHAHDDHLSLPDIRRLATPRTVVVCPQAAAEALAGFAPRVVKPGDRLDVAGLTIEAVPAYNLEAAFLWFVAHPKEEENVGYVVTAAGKRIYHSGDTAFVPELKQLSDLAVAFVAIGGVPNDTMDAAAAARLVNTVKPAVAVPMHFEPGQGQAEAFAKQITGDIRVELPR